MEIGPIRNQNLIFLAILQRLVKIDEGQQKIKIDRTNRQSNLRASCQSIFSLSRHHPSQLTRENKNKNRGRQAHGLAAFQADRVSDRPAPLPVIAKDLTVEYHNLVSNLGLVDDLKVGLEGVRDVALMSSGKPFDDGFSSELKSAGIALTTDLKEAAQTASSSHNYVLGKTVVEGGKVNLDSPGQADA